jgi:hypothetical protein
VDKNIVMLVAHPDDEVIFGWPVLKEAKKIICCSNDIDNPDRLWCKDRIKALKEIGNLVGAEIYCLDYNSEFYRLPTRTGDLGRFVSDILALTNLLVNKYEDYKLFTHNSWGEYGNLDHILVNQIAQSSGKDFITTGVAIDAAWFKVNNLYRVKESSEHNIDLEFYNRCKSIYDKYGCWTWSKDPIEKIKLYENNHSTI